MLQRAPPLRVEVTWDGGVAVVMLTGELDITGERGLTERLIKVAHARPERVVLDLGGLEFVDVAGGRALDRAYVALEAECPVIVRWPRPSARKVFQLGGFMGG